MNKKGQAWAYGFMLGIIIFVLALALAPAVAESTNAARNDSVDGYTGMNCSSPRDNFVKATCIATDISLLYFIGILIFIAGAVVTAKFFFGGSVE